MTAWDIESILRPLVSGGHMFGRRMSRFIRGGMILEVDCCNCLNRLQRYPSPSQHCAPLFGLQIFSLVILFVSVSVAFEVGAEYELITTARRINHSRRSPL